MVSRSRFQPVAIALVLRDDDGNIQIVGSKDIRHSMIEATQDADQVFSCYGDTRWVQGPRSYHIEADCNSVLWQHASPAPTPARIEQRGIYLPDMSFRLLPSPDDT